MRTIYSPTYVLTTYGLIVSLLLDSFLSTPPRPFFDCIGFLIVVTPILRYTIVYNLAAVSDIKRVLTKLWVKNYRDQESFNNWYHTISTMQST